MGAVFGLVITLAMLCQYASDECRRKLRDSEDE